MRQKNIFIGIIVLLGLPTMVTAKVSGPCVKCHTMHNSQAGSTMVSYKIDGVTITTPNSALLNTDCIGCHQGTNSGAVDAPPYVLDTSDPGYGATGTTGNTLAGGTFFWVGKGTLEYDPTGHNIDGLSPEDLRHGVIPPGSSDPTKFTKQLTCAGTNGCHGSQDSTNQTLAIWGGHHNNDMTIWNDGSTTATSYRFLNGVQGKEDSDYEYKPLPGSHNKYYGVNNPGDTLDNGTITNHCARCHNNFHTGSIGNNVWLRHPTNFDMRSSPSISKDLSFSNSEYASYNDSQGVAQPPYSVISPVATNDTDPTTVNNTVYAQANDAIVMCLSCHRAHGSEYDGILRWNYKKWPTPGNTNGCAICHTAKD